MSEVKDYFDKESSTFEKMRWIGNFVSQYDFRVTKEAFIPLMKESDVLLDLGCGPGTWLKEVHHNFKRCIGVDVSPKMLQLCSEKHLLNVDLVCADCHNLPFRNQIFETIISLRVFIYLDLAKALKEAHRILKQDGYMVLLIQVLRQSPYFKLRECLKPGTKFLEEADYLKAHILLTKVSDHFHIEQTEGVIFRENISHRSLTFPPTALLFHLYLKILYYFEKKCSASILKYFFASSIAIKANKLQKHLESSTVEETRDTDFGC